MSTKDCSDDNPYNNDDSDEESDSDTASVDMENEQNEVYDVDDAPYCDDVMRSV